MCNYCPSLELTVLIYILGSSLSLSFFATFSATLPKLGVVVDMMQIKDGKVIMGSISIQKATTKRIRDRSIFFLQLSPNVMADVLYKL